MGHGAFVFLFVFSFSLFVGGAFSFCLFSFSFFFLSIFTVRAAEGVFLFFFCPFPFYFFRFQASGYIARPREELNRIRKEFEPLYLLILNRLRGLFVAVEQQIRRIWCSFFRFLLL